MKLRGHAHWLPRGGRVTHGDTCAPLKMTTFAVASVGWGGAGGWIRGWKRDQSGGHPIIAAAPKVLGRGQAGAGSGGGVRSQQIPDQPLSRVNYSPSQMPPALMATAPPPHLALR